MKKHPLTILTLLIFCAALLPLSASAITAGQELYVQVRSSKMRSAPQLWAPAIADIVYGDSVTVLPGQDTDGAWLKVTCRKREGYVHISAVSTHEIVMHTDHEKPTMLAHANTAGVVLAGKGLGSDGDESGSNNARNPDVVLAGRGFNKQIEAAYARAHALNYSAVNQVEGERLSDSELATFIKAGKLGETK